MLFCVRRREDGDEEPDLSTVRDLDGVETTLTQTYRFGCQPPLHQDRDGKPLLRIAAVV